jgi:DNA polymerase
MKLEDLQKEYDILQEKYGARELTSIYNGGCEESPDICFIFMNPTGRNIASLKEWKGRRSPWLGTKNIWKLFYNIGLLDKNIYDEIVKRKAYEWNENFADTVYDNVVKHKYFITNLGKCTQIDARPLPDYVYQDYLDLIWKEIDIIKPKKIVTFGNQVSSIILGKQVNVSKCRKQCFKKEYNGIETIFYPVYYPVGNGMRNIDKTIEDLEYIIKISS